MNDAKHVLTSGAAEPGLNACQWTWTRSGLVVYVTLVDRDGSDIRLAFDDAALDLLAALRQASQTAVLGKVAKHCCGVEFAGAATVADSAY